MLTTPMRRVSVTAAPANSLTLSEAVSPRPPLIKLKLFLLLVDKSVTS